MHFLLTGPRLARRLRTPASQSRAAAAAHAGHEEKEEEKKKKKRKAADCKSVILR